MSKKHIEECVRQSLESYFKDLRGTEPDGMATRRAAFSNACVGSLLLLRVASAPLGATAMHRFPSVT